MPHIPRCKCIECERVFHSHVVRLVGDGLLRLFCAVRLSKRISCDDVICQKCRCHFIHWKAKMEGDFDSLDCFNRSNVELVNNDDSSVRNEFFFISHMYDKLTDDGY